MIVALFLYEGRLDNHLIRTIPKDIKSDLMELSTLIHYLFLKAHVTQFES